MCFKVFSSLDYTISLVFYLKRVMSLGHIPVIVRKGTDWLKRWVDNQHDIYVEKCIPDKARQR